MPVKIITLYNHKGGVSKTTTTFNLAHLLAASGKKVLVVDADPQCNATELLLFRVIEKLDAEQEDSQADRDLPGTSILDLLAPRVAGDRPDIDTSDVSIIEIRQNLFLLRGDVALSEIEEALAEAHIQRFSNKTHEKKTYVALGAFLLSFGASEGFDYILIDVGPSSGALTRACFLTCDAFFVPIMPDRFNVQAIGTLARILDRWMAEHQQIYDTFVSLGLPVRLGRPRFLGLIMNNFKLYRGEPRKGYKYWMDKIPDSYESKLLPVLKKFSSTSEDLSSGLSRDNCVVAYIPDFQSLAPLLQESGKPIFALTPEDTKVINSGQPYAGKVWEQTVERIASYKSQLDGLLNKINMA